LNNGHCLQTGNPAKETGLHVKHTLCSICNATTHCGIDAYVKDGRIVKIEGTRENPHSLGTLCSKGAASRQYIYNPERLQTPLLRTGGRGSGRFEPISWDQALDLTAEHLERTKERFGPESIVFYVGYPKWMRPFAKRLCHNFGSPNFCTESSTCFTATEMAWKLNYGAFAIPDIKNTNCLLVWSSNPFYSNTPLVTKLLPRIEQGIKLIEVGPLLTPLSTHADIHLRLRPGTSGAMALGLANVIIREALYDREFVVAWGHGFESYVDHLKQFTPHKVAEITGVSAELIIDAARMYAGGKPAALLTSASPTVHHTNGVQNTRAITLLAGLTGNFDVPGGNRPVGPGFLEMSGGIPIREEEFAQTIPFSQMAPRVGTGKYPVFTRIKDQGQAMDIPFQIESGQPYPLKALLAFGLNHRMWPAPGYFKEQLRKLDFIVDIDLFMTDSARLADLVLPCCSSFERSEMKLYPGNFLFMSQKAVEPLGQSRPDVDIITELARRLTPRDELLGKGQDACLDWIFAPSGLTVAHVRTHPTGFVPPGLNPPPARRYEKAGFATPSGKMEFSSYELEKAGYNSLPVYVEPGRSPMSTPEVANAFPLILTTGARLPMFVHGRTFRMPWTKCLRPESMVDINPHDAAVRGIAQGDAVELATPRAAVRVKANLTEVVPAGVVNIYHGYIDVEVNELIAPDYLDPISGFPGFKSLLAQVTKK
jgi:anaerobic selenocysteine-containing dehydrogenase